MYRFNKGVFFLSVLTSLVVMPAIYSLPVESPIQISDKTSSNELAYRGWYGGGRGYYRDGYNRGGYGGYYNRGYGGYYNRGYGGYYNRGYYPSYYYSSPYYYSYPSSYYYGYPYSGYYYNSPGVYLQFGF
jgi:hypothetical protein